MNHLNVSTNTSSLNSPTTSYLTLSGLHPINHNHNATTVTTTPISAVDNGNLSPNSAALSTAAAVAAISPFPTTTIIPTIVSFIQNVASLSYTNILQHIHKFADSKFGHLFARGGKAAGIVPEKKIAGITFSRRFVKFCMCVYASVQWVTIPVIIAMKFPTLAK